MPVSTRSIHHSKIKKQPIKLRAKSLVILLLAVFAAYMFCMFHVTVHIQEKQPQSNQEQQLQQLTSAQPPPSQNDNVKTNTDESSSRGKFLLETKKKDEQNPKKKMARPNFRANPWGHMVQPEVLLASDKTAKSPEATNIKRIVPDDQVLKAYTEPIDRSSWDVKPLPIRQTTKEQLKVIKYSKLNSCQRLPEQWPVDDYPDTDPFLPWIHDVFPTNDGTALQFVAQNKQRCHTGTTDEEEAILEHTAPQVALFQHVPLKKLDSSSTPTNPRFRLSSHEDADPESISTRFICRWKPSGDVTFSEFNNDFEWASRRKGQSRMFSPDGRNNKQVLTSQLTFTCPVPAHLVETVRSGASVVDDWATIFVDLIPVRTPPRYGPPDEFLTPRYAKSLKEDYKPSFDPHKEWGDAHILPQLEDSGRWENIPVCKPSLMTYEPAALQGPKAKGEKKHHLISCLWASTGYTTRGNRYAINDGQRRMLEWIAFNKLLGFDHFYIYDNSAAFTNESSLFPFEEIFPGDVTVIKWPSKICNNNPNNVDSVGERSSQYAAESSCRLRFGPHTNWIGQFDIDEYLVPMGNYTSLLPLLDKLDEEGNKIVSFASWRAWPRRTHINDPDLTTVKSKELCARKTEECFELSVRNDTTIMEAYNCDRQKPGEKTVQMPAEKQLYRADYVKQHFIHYSTITESTMLGIDEYAAKKFKRTRPFPDPLSRFIDEVNEGLMLHSKSIARQDTAAWKKNCHKDGRPIDQCRIGFPWPEEGAKLDYDKDGWQYNCYVNPRIDNYWAPMLKQKLKEMGYMTR